MFESVIEYFNHLDQKPVQRFAFLVGGMLLLWILEGAIPLIKMNYKKSKIKHASVNFLFTVIHLIIHTFLAIFIILISDFCKANQFGIVYWTNASILWTIIISFAVLDFFGGWLVHIIEHKIPILWKIHTVHHSDTNVDVTTGLRHHPFESVIRGLFFFAGIFVSGAPMFAVMIYQTVLVFATAFTHANISLPKSVDKILSYVFISPNMHKVHHHYKQPYTDSNYGAILSIWDRALGTFRTLNPDQIKYGIDRYYRISEDESIKTLMMHPFRKTDETIVND